MKRTSLGFLAAMTLLTAILAHAAAGDAKDSAIQKDRKQIAGTWKAVSVEVNGNKLSDDDARKIRVINKTDGTWILQSEEKEVCRGTSTIDPTKKPKALDFTITEGDGKDNMHLAIYELGDKTRRMCFAPPGKDRPTEFATVAGSEHILVVFEREKSK